VNQAFRDLHGKEVGLTLYRLLAGTKNRVRAYARALEFHLTSAEVGDFYTDSLKQGYSAFKVKVGHPDLQWDIARLKEVLSVVGSDATLMIDANEAWSPKQAIRPSCLPSADEQVTTLLKLHIYRGQNGSFTPYLRAKRNQPRALIRF
jgi:L-alanine-DL-glutamate epimerase-like enolase superfamily enzyme